MTTFQQAVDDQFPDAVENENLIELPYLIDMLMDLHEDIRLNPEPMFQEGEQGPFLLVTLELPWGNAQLHYWVRMEEHEYEDGEKYLMPTSSLSQYIAKPQHPTVPGVVETLADYVSALTRISSSYAALRRFENGYAPDFIVFHGRSALARNLRAIQP